MGAGYLSSLLVIGFLAHLALISFSKEDDLKKADSHEDHSWEKELKRNYY